MSKSTNKKMGKKKGEHLNLPAGEDGDTEQPFLNGRDPYDSRLEQKGKLIEYLHI